MNDPRPDSLPGSIAGRQPGRDTGAEAKAELWRMEAGVPPWRIGTLLLVWSVPVALATLLIGLTTLTTPAPPPFWRMFAVAAACWYSWALMTPVVARTADRFVLDRPIHWRVAGVHVCGAVAACFVQALVTAVCTQLLVPAPEGLAAVFVYWLVTLLPAGVVVYAAVVGLRTAEVRRVRLAARERHAQRLSAQLAEAQLGALRAQLQPHFLFNTLNAVIALVRDGENARAVEALTTLGALLRTSLRSGSAHEVTLGEEVVFTSNYLAIERLRFGDRLSVAIDVPDSLRDARVPSFLLQPFVENALRHGLRHRPGGGSVEVSARAEPHGLLLRVVDDGAGLSADWEERSASGFGVANSRARLARMYGERAAVRIARRSGSTGTTVEIVLPLVRGAAA